METMEVAPRTLEHAVNWQSAFQGYSWLGHFRVATFNHKLHER